MSEQPGAQPSGKGRSPGMPAVRVVLLVILVVLLAALLYDRFVVAPRANQAVEAVKTLMDGIEAPSMGERKEPVTDAVVKEAIGKSSSEREESGGFVIDRYSWRRGLLVNSYHLYVVYQKAPDGNLEMIYYGRSKPTADDLEGLK